MLVDLDVVIQRMRLEIKHRHGRSVSDFALACGVSPSTAYRVLQGYVQPNDLILKRLRMERVVAYRVV